MNTHKEIFENNPLFINGAWEEGHGEPLRSINPSTGETLWTGRSANKSDVALAVAAAKEAFTNWSQLRLPKRLAYLERFITLLQKKKEALARIILLEVGKPFWEAKQELEGIIGKLPASLKAFEERCASFGQGNAQTVFRPHGPVAVFGSFNFPGHIAHGHIIPALLAGNTVVVKPSEYTPWTMHALFEIWEEAGIPPGVLNLVQGEAETGEMLSTHKDIRGVFFTGSSKTGIAIEKAILVAGVPKIVALEMGGNNPLVVYEPENLKMAALMTVQSAYITAGQRCTCARRLILPSFKNRDGFLQLLKDMIDKIDVFPPNIEPPEPFMGPVISEKAALNILAAQERLEQCKGEPDISCKHLSPGTGLLSPGLLNMTHAHKEKVEDSEIFGPLLQYICVDTLEEALEEANNTRYGLCSGIITKNPKAYRYFVEKIRAGIIKWNQPTTGSTAWAPFGGIGLSGNFRPSGFFAADYCSYPVVLTETPPKQPGQSTKLPPGLYWPQKEEA